MRNEVHQNLEEKMEKTISVLKEDLGVIRAGRANPALLDKIVVDYYGTPTPLKQIAGVSAPEPRMIVVSPYDKSALKDIEKAILISDMGFNPSNDGSQIRISIPQLTEERRKELTKLVAKTGENAKVALRNSRRDANDKLKKMEKDGEMSEDDSKKAVDEVQKIIDKYTKEVDEIVAKKEKEVMEV